MNLQICVRLKGEKKMKRLKKAGVLTVLLCLMVLLPVMQANAGFRRQNNGKYRYYTTRTGGKYVKSCFKNIKKGNKTYTYHFDANGYMSTGWKKIRSGGKVYHYYFDRNGRMFKNRTKNGHYLQKNGRMLINDYAPNGKYYGADGSEIPGYRKDVKNGFKKTKKGYKYRQQDGTYATKTWKCIKDSEGKYYWYYFYSNGIMAKNKWVGSKWVDKQGRWVPGKTK